MSANKTPYPPYQPFADALKLIMEKNKLTTMQFCEKVYGRGANGHVGGVGSVYPILSIQAQPSDDLRERIWTIFKVRLPDKMPYRQYTDARPIVRKSGMRGKHAGHKARARASTQLVPTTPVHAALQEYAKTPGAQLEPMSKVRNGPPLFALTIGQDGTSNVTFNMIGVSAERALHCMQALASADLIKVTESG